MTLALVAVAALLTVGLILRIHVPIFQWLFIPASVIAGLLGLCVVQLATRTSALESTAIRESVVDLADQWSSWPGWLIAVVFAALLLEKQAGNVRGGIRRTTSQVIMVWIIVVGQTATGLLLTWLVVQANTNVPNSFGMLIETGFAGGHGTAAAMGLVFSNPAISLESGLDLGILMATAGLIYGVISGIFWINVAAWLGWIKKAQATGIQSHGIQVSGGQTIGGPTDEIRMHDQPIGMQVIDREIIDPLLLQMIWLSLAFAIGLFCQTVVSEVGAGIDQLRGIDASSIAMEGAMDGTAELSKRLRASTVLGSFPLFIYTLLGGWIVRKILQRCSAEHLIDNRTILRLSAVAMDVLVVAAIASLSIQAVASLLLPFLVLLAGGIIWTGFCLMVLSRLILPSQHWFQLGLINYGMSTGTTATGFVLLRIVDPEIRTKAAEDYALAAPFSAPFIGGGMITVALPLLVLERIPIWTSALAATTIVFILIIVGIRTRVVDQQAEQ